MDEHANRMFDLARHKDRVVIEFVSYEYVHSINIRMKIGIHSQIIYAANYETGAHRTPRIYCNNKVPLALIDYVDKFGRTWI